MCTYIEWIFCFRRCNRSNINKIQKRILPSQKEIIAKTKKVQRSLQALCDDDSSGSESSKSFAKLAKFTKEVNNKDCRRLQPLEITITDSSSMTSESEEELEWREKADRDKKCKFISSSRDSSSSTLSLVSKPVINGKGTSKKKKNISDSDDSSIASSDEITKNQCTKISYNKSTKKQKGKSLNMSDDSDSESDNGSSNKVSKTSNNLPKHVQLDKKKNANSHNAKVTKNKVKKYRDATSESENEDVENKKQSTEKHSASHTTSHNESKKAQEHQNLKKQSSQKIREDDSDSSSKEFQKEKLLHTKYSIRKLKDLNVDYTKLKIEGNSSNEKITNRKDNCEESNLSFDKVKEILGECKIICSSFQKYIETIEDLYENKDEDKLVSISTHKVNKYTTMLNKKQENLTAFYELWLKKPRHLKKSVSKKVYKEVKCNERSSDESDTQIKHKTHGNNSEDKRNTMEVSECDSEEIFSADESRSSRKMHTTHDTDAPEINKNRVSSDAGESSYEDAQIPDKPKDSEEINENSRDDLSISPVLGTSEHKKANVGGLRKQPDNKKKCANDSNDKIQTKNRDNDPEIDQAGFVKPSNYENETDNLPSSKTTEETTLQSNNNAQANLAADKMINESIYDIFGTSSDEDENARNQIDMQETNVEINNDEMEHVPTTKSTNDIDTNKIPSEDEADHAAVDTDNDQVPNAGRRTPSAECNGKEVDSASHNDLEKVAPATSKKKSHDVDNDDSEQVNVPENTARNDAESIDIAEELAKQALLQSDSDNVLSPDADLTKKGEESKKDDATKEDETEAVDSGAKTIILPAATDKDVANSGDAKRDVKDKSNDKPNENISDKTTSSSDEDAKAEEAAKKALLACSTSDDSTISPSQDSGEIVVEKDTSKKSDSDTTNSANIKAKKALLASSNSENSSSEMETNVSGNEKKNNKRIREVDSDTKSVLAAVKRRRLILSLHKNIHYKNDEKLRMTCEIHITRLSKKILKQHSHALQKSKQYLEHKALKRYQEFSLKHVYIVLHRMK